MTSQEPSSTTLARIEPWDGDELPIYGQFQRPIHERGTQMVGDPWLVCRTGCPQCGAVWIAMVEWGTVGKECPECHTYDTTFVWNWDTHRK